MSVPVLHPDGAVAADKFKALYQLLAGLARATETQDVYQAALSGLLDVTSADRAAIQIFDDDGVIRFKASRGLTREYQTAATGYSPWGKGEVDSHPLTVQDVLHAESPMGLQEALRREGIRALAVVPLALDAGVFGNLTLYYAEPHEFDPEELEVAQVIAAHVALAAERKRAELARIRSEKQLQTILDNSANVVFVKDLQGRYVLVNRLFEELFHVARANVLGQTDFAIFPAGIAERFQANDHAALAAGRPLVIEDDAPHDDGIHTYISTTFPLEGPDGSVTGVCGISTDVTERRQLEAASRHLASIVESSDDAIVSKDLRGIITSWNTGAERIFGYTSAEVVGKPVSILAAPDCRNEMPEILARIVRGQRIEHYETRRLKKDGQIIDVSLTVSPIRDAAGRIVGASKIVREITERKQAEQERALLLPREREARRIAEQLNRVAPRLAAQLNLEKLVQEITDIATSLIGAEIGSFFHNVTNEKGESYMLFAHSGAAREDFKGFPMPDNTNLFGPTFRGGAIVRSEDVTKDPHYGKNPAHQNPPHHNPTNHNPTNQGTPAGRIPLRSYLAAPVLTRSGEVLGGLFFGHSTPSRFTETHEAIITGIASQAAIAIDNARLFEQSQWIQMELRRSNEELLRANQDLEVFAYSASHDLKEPLRTIAISAQLVERRAGDGLHEDVKTFLTNILKATNRMGVLIEDLLGYTRATKYEEGPTPNLDSRRVLDTVLESLRGAIDEAGAKVTSAELPIVAIHEIRLSQLFQNLISNAIKYRGEEAPNIHVAAHERDGWCVFSVTDNGIGIEPQFAEQIFGLFKRLHGRDEYPGSGIGLAICQRVVEQYGGRIWLEQSALGKGSTFCFSLPSRR